MSNPFDSPQPPNPEQSGQPPQQPYQPPQQFGLSPQQPPQQTNGKAIASLVLGIVGLLAWCCPLVGIPVTVTGLFLGINAMNSQSRTLAIVGVALCAIGLLLSIGNAIIGAMMAVGGNQPF